MTTPPKITAIASSSQVLVGDCLQVLRTLPPKSVHCCVTSPPYFGLRDYQTASWEGGDSTCQHSISKNDGDPKAVFNGRVNRGERGKCLKCGAVRVDKQIGLENTPELFVAKLVKVFREVWRVLRDDGTLWLNLGDSFATGTKAKRQQSNNPGVGANCPDAQNSVPIGLKTKDLIGIPWRVAFALQADGWYLRQDIIWHKPNPMPESVTDRCTKSHEYIFLLSKNQQYYLDHIAIQEPAAYDGRKSTRMKGSQKSKDADFIPGGNPNYFHAGGHERWQQEDNGNYVRNKRSVWSVASQPFKGAHFATFPPKLIEPCILAGTSAAGCCPTCGTPYKRITEKKRVATRPGTNTKIACKNSRMYQERDPQHAGEYKAERHAMEVGNRDPLRHVSRVVSETWQPSCSCDVSNTIPCTVLDPFSGAGTTGLVSRRHRRNYLGIELNPDYAEMSRARIAQEQPLLKHFG